MIFNLFKKTKKAKRSPSKQMRKTHSALHNVSTKDDVQTILREIAQSREAVLQEVSKIPDSLSLLLVNQITSPLKDFISSELNNTQAVKQLSIPEAVHHSPAMTLSNNQAVKQKKSIDDVIVEMKERLERLSQRHLKILNILVQNREAWLEYDELGKFCSPSLTGSCIRGYIADLINSYSIPIEKKNFGRKSKVRISQQAVKELAITKLL